MRYLIFYQLRFVGFIPTLNKLHSFIEQLAWYQTLYHHGAITITLSVVGR